MDGEPDVVAFYSRGSIEADRFDTHRPSRLEWLTILSVRVPTKEADLVDVSVGTFNLNNLFSPGSISPPTRPTLVGRGWERSVW
jgi:hypothetical protein